jgi:hypothetical protein
MVPPTGDQGGHHCGKQRHRKQRKHGGQIGEMFARKELIHPTPQSGREQHQEPDCAQQRKALIATTAHPILAKTHGGLAHGTPGALGDGKSYTRIQPRKQLNEVSIRMRILRSARLRSQAQSTAP